VTERKPFIGSKTVWFISELIQAHTELTLLRHLRGDHGAPVPESLIGWAEKSVSSLEQAFTEYRAAKKKEEAEKRE